MKTLLVFMIILVAATTALTQSTEQILGAYMQLKDALVKSDTPGAILAVKVLQTTTNETVSFPGKEDLVKATKAMLKVSSQEHLRETFGAVSVAMWKVVQDMKNLKTNVYYQYCPMKDKYWLSYDSAIKNPYYGSVMLSCGSVKDKIPAQ